MNTGKGRLPNGYWHKRNNVIAALKPLIEKLGRFPTSTEIKAFDHRILRGIQRHHGGVERFRDSCGFGPLRKQRGYWCELKNAIRRVEELEQQLGRFPSLLDVRRYEVGLFNAINKHYGGMTAFLVLIGRAEELPERPRGYWRSRKVIEEEYLRLKQKLGRVPTQKDLREAGLHGLETAIVEEYGGLRALREVLGLKSPVKPDGFWKSLDNVIQRVREIQREIGYFPSHKDLQELGESSLAVAIGRYHGGFFSLREAMGEDSTLSRLEGRVKLTLDKLLAGHTFVDNVRKALHEDYGIELRHPVTGKYLEIDRFYPELRLAIEVQGRQHYEAVWGEVQLRSTQKADETKRIVLKRHNITLVEIPYFKASEADILAMLRSVGVGEMAVA